MTRPTFDEDEIDFINGLSERIKRLETARSRVFSALPADPGDGQEIYLQTQTMAVAGVSPWWLRYRAWNPDGTANTNTYKWEPVGNCCYENSDYNGEGMANTANVATDFASSLAFTLPLAGDYVVEAGASVGPPGNVQANLYIYDGVAGLFSDTYIGSTPYGSKVIVPPSMPSPRAAGAVIKLRGSTNANSVTWVNKWLKVKPKRVG